METFVEVALVGLVLLSVSLTISLIGKERPPITPGAAVVALFIGLAQAAGIIYLAHT